MRIMNLISVVAAVAVLTVGVVGSAAEPSHTTASHGVTGDGNDPWD